MCVSGAYASREASRKASLQDLNRKNTTTMMPISSEGVIERGASCTKTMVSEMAAGSWKNTRHHHCRSLRNRTAIPRTRSRSSKLHPGNGDRCVPLSRGMFRRISSQVLSRLAKMRRPGWRDEVNPELVLGTSVPSQPRVLPTVGTKTTSNTQDADLARETLHEDRREVSNDGELTCSKQREASKAPPRT